MSTQKTLLNCPCQGADLSTIFTYDKPPEGEVRFRFSDRDHYYREVKRCDVCGHFVSVHDMDTSRLYKEDYVSSNYGEAGILETFNRINALDPAKSDNVGRVNRILEYASNHFQKEEGKPPYSVLDIGSGLCVFLHRMKEAGWDCTALDPDGRCAEHAQDVVGVKAVCGNFMEVEGLVCYDLITFNKVLEHVEDPVTLLQKSLKHLNPNGLVYVEVPDGEMAAKEGKGREEFFIDHIHVFSAISLVMVARQAGFIPVLIERLQEPSTKYTLRAFLTVND